MIEKTKKKIAVLLPIYNDWSSLLILIPRLDQEFKKLNLIADLVIVDDGSVDLSAKEMIRQLKTYGAINSIKELKLTRNYGNQQAIAIGFGFITDNYQCDLILVMDADLEDNPYDIAKLVKAHGKCENDELVFAKRSKRSENILFRVFYKIYQIIFHLLTNERISFGNFSLMSAELGRKVANLSDLWNHYPAAIIRSRLKYTTVLCKRSKREDGKSSMNFTRLIAHAFCGLSVFADLLAIRILIASLIASGICIFSGIFLLFFRCYSDIIVRGSTSVIISVCFVFIAVVIGFALTVNFQVAINRTRIPLIPKQSYSLFIQFIKEIYTNKKLAKEEQTLPESINDK